MTEKRVILLVGKTGNGKSTIANVLTNTKDFKEFSGSQSGTKKIRVGKFQHEEIEYTVIDTPGINDTNPENEKNIYMEIVEAVYSFKDGINQVLFVTKGRLTKEEKNCYNLLFEAFFDEEKIPNFITIVRTNFGNYVDEVERENDINEMKDQGNEISNLIKFREGKNVIHIDNHPRHQEDRDDSRNVLLKHLKECNEIYRHEIPSSVEKDKRVEETKIVKDEIIEILSLKKNANGAIKFGDRMKSAGKKIYSRGLSIESIMTAGFIVPAVGFQAYVLGYTIESVGGLVHQSSLNSRRKKVVERVETCLSKSNALLEKLKECEENSDKLDEVLEECIDELIEERKFHVVGLEIEEMFQKKSKEEPLNIS
ncbi:822_t:CDS:1 [Acaulospora morrowiae]|uniref:822_t:CDS:1 n=1 Tax=Acaulospora morrowiae TaxID=94023 RepID=A0A9N9FSC1_9GLOM|nr:822_t:CDS:1 [Acaulospora morrowiae]